MLEAYEKHGTIIIAHRRERGRVYFHVQREADSIVTAFGQMSEANFDAQVAGARAYDVRLLTALREVGG